MARHPPADDDREFAAQYIADVRETDPIYAAEGLCHPGLLPRLFNWALMHNVVLGPWIHVGSNRPLRRRQIGDELSVRAKIVANDETKGHRFVELDGLVVADGRARSRASPTRHLSAPRAQPGLAVGATNFAARTVGLRASRRPKLQLPELRSRRPRARHRHDRPAISSPASDGSRSISTEAIADTRPDATNAAAKSATAGARRPAAHPTSRAPWRRSPRPS